MPTDGDLFRTVTLGVRWTAMPTWHELPDMTANEKLAFGLFLAGSIVFFVWVVVLAVRK